MRTTKRTMILGTMLTTALMTATDMHAGSPIRISGEVDRPENNLAPVTITVRNADGDTIWTRTSRTGRFAIRLQENEQYTISFDQPRSIQKEVTIDALHAQRPGPQSRSRKVSFEVVLEFDPTAELYYARPVGGIDFHKGGRMQVRHDYALVTADRR